MHKTKKLRLRETQDKQFALGLLIPSLLLITFVNIYPFISGVLYSFRTGNIIHPGKFVGVQNYIEIFSNPRFWNSLKFSALFSVVTVIGSYICGLLLALILNQNVPGRGFFRAALLIPWVIPGVVAVTAWRWLMNDQTCLFNQILGLFHLGPYLFLADPKWARIMVFIIKIWASTPFVMISLLASLQNIDQEMYEAATLDTNNKVKIFWYITFPYLKPISLVLLILLIVWSFNDFGLVYLLTKGGPNFATESVVYLAYMYPFTYGKLGPGSAVAVISMVILTTLSVLMTKLRTDVE